MGSILFRVPFDIDFKLSGKGTEKEPYAFKALNRDNTDFSITISNSDDYFNIGKFNLRMIELIECKNIKIVDSLFKIVKIQNCKSIQALNLMVSKKFIAQNSHDFYIYDSKLSNVIVCENSTGLIQNTMIRKISHEDKRKVIIKNPIFTKDKAPFRHENLFINLLKQL